MKKPKITVTRTAAELAKALGLTPADGAEIALRSDLNSKIVEVVQRKGLTHAQVARLARTSRTRVTAIMNRNTKDISTVLLLALHPLVPRALPNPHPRTPRKIRPQRRLAHPRPRHFALPSFPVIPSR